MKKKKIKILKSNEMFHIERTRCLEHDDFHHEKKGQLKHLPIFNYV